MKFNILKHKKNIWKVVVLLGIILIAVILVHKVIKSKKVQFQNNIKNVKTIKAELTSLSTNVDYAGTLSANEEVSISPKTSGKIETLNVKVGSTVKIGDVLFTLDSSSLQAQLQQQQASVDSAKATLNKTESSDVEQQVVQAKQAIDSSNITYNDAKTNYDRTESLYSSDAASKQDLDTAKTKLDSASVALSSAQQNLNLIQQKIAPESMDVAEAQVNQAEASMESIQTQINDTIIKSPISGVVSAVNIHEGEISSSSQACVTVVDLSSVVVETDVPGDMLSKIQVNQSVPITIPALSNKKITGSIITITPEADSKTQEYLVKIKIDNSDNSLRPGMFSKVSLPDVSKNNIIAVQNQAIKVENGVSYLYKVQNNKIKKISVNTGLSNDKITEIISSEISPGDNIVSEGQTFLNDGDKVKMIK